MLGKRLRFLLKEWRKRYALEDFTKVPLKKNRTLTKRSFFESEETQNRWNKFFQAKNIKTEKFYRKDSREKKFAHYHAILSRKLNLLPVILFKKCQSKLTYQKKIKVKKKWPRSKNTCLSIKRLLRQEKNKIPELENYYPDNYIIQRTTFRWWKKFTLNLTENNSIKNVKFWKITSTFWRE